MQTAPRPSAFSPQTAARRTAAGTWNAANCQAQGPGTPRAIVALKTLIKMSGTARYQASLRGKSLPPTIRERASKQAICTANPPIRQADGSSSSFSSPSTMKWIGTTISVVTSII